MIWFLLAAGLLLLLLGAWGGPPRRRRPEKSSRIPREATVQEAWDILTSPVQYDEELIKIPEHRPWYIPSRDRRFQQGVMVGLGVGCLAAALTFTFLPSKPAAGTDLAKSEQGAGKTPTGEGSTGQKTGSETEGQPSAATETESSKPPASTPEPDPAPKEITFTVEPGSASQEIAADLKEAGLITSEREFLDRVVELGVETSLQAGTFVIPTGASLDAVIEELTR